MALRALRDADQAQADGPLSDDASDDTSAPIGGRIRELRKAYGLTLQELAGTVGISVSYLSQIERDVSRLPIGVLKQIADTLGFCDVFHFSKAFKQEIGFTPSDYRRRVRGQRIATAARSRAAVLIAPPCCLDPVRFGR